MKTVEYTEQNLQEMANILSKLSLADTFKLMKILDNVYGIRIVNNILEKETYCPPGDGDYSNDDDCDCNKLYKVYLYKCGSQKLQVVKIIKDLTGLGLKESKDIADRSAISPALIKECRIDDANNIKHQLEAAGAIVTMGVNL